jgi:hypothetical protein
MYNSPNKGYCRPVSTSAPLEPDAIINPHYWHVFGGPLKGTTRGRKNFITVTAGPVLRSATPEVTGTTIDGATGETFKYLGTFTHDPSDKELDSLKPKDYR